MAHSFTLSTRTTVWPRHVLAGVKAAFSAVGTALIVAASANRRLQLVERLSAKSDEELAALGLRREDIIRRVFHDMLDV